VRCGNFRSAQSLLILKEQQTVRKVKELQLAVAAAAAQKGSARSPAAAPIASQTSASLSPRTTTGLEGHSEGNSVAVRTVPSE
jgi:hypothetical protein